MAHEVRPQSKHTTRFLQKQDLATGYHWGSGEHGTDFKQGSGAVVEGLPRTSYKCPTPEAPHHVKPPG